MVPADQYVGVGVLIIVALLFPLGTLFATRLFRPRRTPVGARQFMLGIHYAERTDDRYAEDTYECGNPLMTETSDIDFHFQYYMYAIIFVAADVMAIFLILWGLDYQELSDSARMAMLGFVAVLVIGVLYALRKESMVWI